jgi:hypothetical protein
MKPFSDYANRDEYRKAISQKLVCWRTEHRETELFVCAQERLETQAYNAVVQLRAVLDGYIKKHPHFGSSLLPVEPLRDAPSVIADMCRAGKAAGVGPMAAVAGAFAAHVGRDLLIYTSEVVVENGGDVFMKTEEQRTVGIYAGCSPVSMKLGIVVDSCETPVAVCTSSGTVGPSLSFGCADAAVVVSHDACLADACATRLGNEIRSAADISRALNMIAAIPGVTGAVAVVGEACGAVGDIMLTAL